MFSFNKTYISHFFITIKSFTWENQFINFTDGIFNFADDDTDVLKFLTSTVFDS